ncbi:MAG: prepilin-type N-terminal cleavage/methylation domain-containing protein [Candidatus Azambacteria bacterium]|nr:prepilin-type N-terminal cleavage/methylation domain-containing protein [Candidatus Azambacteria bacterium]
MNKGFTVVEMLVVLSIIGVITGIVIFNVGSQQRNSALLRSAQNLSLNLRRIENFALSSKTFKTSGVPCGWGAHFNGAGSASYIIFADKAASVNCWDRDFARAVDGSEDFENINLDPQITISSLSGGLSDIIFSPPEPSVVFVPNQTTVSIILNNRDFATREVRINKTGFISSP